MKLFFIPVLIMLGCGSTKSDRSVATSDSVVVSNSKNNIGQDSINKLLTGKSGPGAFVIPTCIKSKLDSFKSKEIHERPQKMVEYTYKGKKVYYVIMPCCDFFNEVYDEKCNFLGSPDGGITGKGDGKLPDFFAEVKNEKLIWEAAK